MSKKTPLIHTMIVKDVVTLRPIKRFTKCPTVNHSKMSNALLKHDLYSCKLGYIYKRIKGSDFVRVVIFKGNETILQINTHFLGLGSPLTGKALINKGLILQYRSYDCTFIVNDYK